MAGFIFFDDLLSPVVKIYMNIPILNSTVGQSWKK